jgi:hypothetical protein
VVGNARLLVLTKNPDEESPGLLRQLCPPGLDLIMSSAAWTDYGVPGSPYVIVVDGRSGRVKGEGSGTSLTQISGLMQQAFGDGASSPSLISTTRPIRNGDPIDDDGSTDQGKLAKRSRPFIKPRSDTEREIEVDRALLAAGIGPGHPSLYPDDDRRPGITR